MSSETSAVPGAEAVISDAWATIRAMAVDPAGGLVAEYKRLGPDRALRASGVLAIGATLASTIGTTSGVQAAMGVFGGFGRSGSSASAFFQIWITTMIFAAVAAGVSFLVRRTQQSTAQFGPDAFTVGAAMLPVGLAMLLTGLLGSWQIATLLVLSGMVYLIILLYTGLTALAELSMRVAPLVVIAMLAVATLVTRALM